MLVEPNYKKEGGKGGGGKEKKKKKRGKEEERKELPYHGASHQWCCNYKLPTKLIHVY